MAWFKVDDGIHSHKKARRAGVEAMGLWVMCGAWSADNLEDGFIPAYVAETFTTRACQYAKRLVSAGLWSEATKDGDTGWQFHDWDAYQPMREDVEEKREAWRERQRKSRSQKNVSRSDTPVTHAGQPRDSRESHGESHAPVTESRPVPSRPVPVVTAQKRGHRIPDDFAVDDLMREWAKTSAPNCDVDRATEKFIDHWAAKTGRDATKLDWRRAWQNWLRNESDRTPTWKREQVAPSRTVYVSEVPWA